jgi:hypothetical protein
MVKLVGTGRNQVPTNNMLGNMAFQNKEGASVDLLGLAAGTAAAPSLIYTGDPNTGMWFPAADTVAWSTSGVERVRIDLNGNFGIGTSSPEQLLSIVSSAVFQPQVLVSATASNAFGPYWNSRKLRGASPASAADALGTFIFQSTDTGGTVRNAAILSSVSQGAGATWHSGYFVFQTFDTSGTGGNRLEVKETGVAVPAGTVSLPSISTFGDTNTGIFFPAADTIAWSTGGVERMRISAAGNVGVGTSSPGHLLQVNSTGSTISATTSSTTTQFTGPGLRLYNTNASMGTQAGLGIASLILDASATQGYMSFFQTNNSGGFVQDILRYNYNASLWQFYTNATEKLRVDTNGNLGLGATAFGTSAAVTLAIATGTAPTTGPADTIQIYSTDLTAGNTMLSLFTEGTVVNANTTAAATHRIAIRVNGTVYYLLAHTSAT